MPLRRVPRAYSACEVRGFAPSWTEAQMKSAFALYGGAARIQLSEDETSGRREARVQLKKAQNMQRAVPW